MAKSDIKLYIEENINLKKTILEDKELIGKITKIIFLIDKCFKSGHKLLIAGNGGSAADAQHFSAEIIARYKKERKGYPAISLTTDTSFLTAWSNDYTFDTIFARQIEALGKENDIFIGISTSGNSKNIIEAVKKAKKLRLKTICLLGKGGGELGKICGIPIVIPSSNTPRVQEAHGMLIHIISEELEKEFI